MLLDQAALLLLCDTHDCALIDIHAACRKRVLSDLDALDALSGEEVRGAAQRLFADANMFTGRVLPLRQPRVTVELDLGV